MSGDLDYLIKARVRDISDYDQLYRRLIKRLPLMDVSASFVTESLKSTMEIPVFRYFFKKRGHKAPEVSPFRLIIVTARIFCCGLNVLGASAPAP